MKGFFATLGRMLLSLVFIFSAFGKLLDWQGTMGYLNKSLSDLMNHMANMGWAQQLLAEVQSHAALLLGIALLLELIGGLLVFFSVQVRFGAFLLILFMIPMTLMMHPFWYLEGMERQLHMAMFAKNISILGGLIVVCALGKGKSKEAKAAAPAKK